MTANNLKSATIALHASPPVPPEPGDPAPPQTALLEHRLALLAGTEAALVLTGRLSALALLLSESMVAGDNLVCADQLCGESHGFLDLTCSRGGRDVRFVSSPWELPRWEQQIDERTQLLLVECPSDPNMFVPDLGALSALASDHCIPLVVDTTVATPLLCAATRQGAELSLTSLAGDLTGQAGTGGALLGSRQRIEPLRQAAARAPGWPLPAPVAESALLGLETLADRMRTKQDNTRAVRAYLLERRADGDVTFVDHPSLRKHPQHRLARRTFSGHAGALISFGVRGSEDAALRLVSALRLIAAARAPGGNRSTICHSHSTTHAGLSDRQKADAVIRPEVLRLCVGNEHVADILEDLERGFAALGNATVPKV